MSQRVDFRDEDNPRGDGTWRGTPWHLSKSVPIALIMAFALQSATAVWWASDMSARVEEVERKVSDYGKTKEAVARLAALQESILVEVRETRKEIQKMNESQKGPPGRGLGHGRRGDGRH